MTCSGLVGVWFGKGSGVDALRIVGFLNGVRDRCGGGGGVNCLVFLTGDRVVKL